MEREILFRGKDIGGKSWFYGSYLKTDDNTNECFGRKNIIIRHQIVQYEAGDWNLGGWAYYDVIPETIGQFTGLTDKNGVKIFEGDIVFAGYGEYYQGQHEHSATMIIDMADYEALNALCNANVVEVIGNIHDTPDFGLEEESE